VIQPELLRREVPEGAGRPIQIVVHPPVFDGPLRVGQAEEPVLVEALVAQLAIEALDETVLLGLTGIDELQLDAGLVSPLVERPARQLRAPVAAILQTPCARLLVASGPAIERVT
jgi:hypothetical protein